MEKKQSPIYLISLPPQYIVTQERTGSGIGSIQDKSQPFDTIAKARQYAEDLARVNKGDTFHVYQINRPVYYKESCRLNNVQWFVDPQLAEEEDRG